MSKDKEESNTSTKMDKEIHIQFKAVKNDAYYVKSSYGYGLIIIQFQLKENLKIITVQNGLRPYV